MAATKGHGNPHWTRDETILALDLYFKVGGALSSQHEDLVAELSKYLRSAPFHEGKKKNGTFRNVEGVGFKVQNLRAAATGKGLKNVSKVDREVWKELGDKPELVSFLAKEIKANVQVIVSSEVDNEVIDYLDQDYLEGDVKHKAHRHRERCSKLRKDLLKKRINRGGLACDICGYEGAGLPKEIVDSAFEAHHVKPLGDSTGPQNTKLSDMSLLCATCHRLLHRLMKVKDSHIDIEGGKKLLGNKQL
ncbi:HNH endonuclease [Vibrio rotiferianus]|uniref:HNH endonuclease n=1 Tax=Vibrio rotiferianus TaxID=190895 RepID=UPI00111066CD|nr:HNH endonuclease [Vibrio rotiferianus]TMX64592.1 HNH endonuclease [Vibrio rotiferianus]